MCAALWSFSCAPCNRDDATNVFAAYSGNPYAINPASDAIYEGLFNLPAIALTGNNNVVAVELKQADAAGAGRSPDRKRPR